MTNPIQISIPIELTAAMVIRAEVIKDEARAKELAIELHEIVAKATELYSARVTKLVATPEDHDDNKPLILADKSQIDELVVLEEEHRTTPLELADFQLACWRTALVSTDGLPEDASDCEEAKWISEVLAGLVEAGDDSLYWRWRELGDIITGSDLVASFEAAKPAIDRLALRARLGVVTGGKP
jgi:hypothetical protein